MENQPKCHTWPSYFILLSQLIATLIHYLCTIALSGLTDRFVFREGFTDHVKSQLRQWGPGGD